MVFQKAVLFAPYSRLTWKKRSISTDDKYKSGRNYLKHFLDFFSYKKIIFSVYISLQLVSIPCLIGLLAFSLVDIDYHELPERNLSASALWWYVLESSGYPGGVFNYCSKYFHYYLQTNIYFATLLPAVMYFGVLAILVNIYFKLLHRIRNYEFSLYRAKYSAMYGAYR